MKSLYTLLSVVLIFSVSACSSQSATALGYEDLTNEEFNQKMNESDVMVLDVRTPGEIAKGKIGEAIEIDFKAKGFSEKVAALDKEKTYLVYCAGGYRSSKACKIMSKQGFTKLYNLDNGYGSWKSN